VAHPALFFTGAVGSSPTEEVQATRDEVKRRLQELYRSGTRRLD
jgi:hypothetical protein